MLETMLRAWDQVELERKLDALQATLAAGMGRADGMADRRTLNQLLVQGIHRQGDRPAGPAELHGRAAGRQPTFSAADLERARATLRGRPEEAAIYNAWIEVARIVDYTSLEAIGKALVAEKRLVWVISSILGLLRHGLLRHARQCATRIITPVEWATLPARREHARRASMADERISFAEVMDRRAWWLAPEELKARARSLPDFDDESASACDYLLRLDAAAAWQLHQAAAAEVLELIKARKLRFVRDGQNVSAKLKAGKHLSGRVRRPTCGRGRVHAARAGRGRAAGVGGAGTGGGSHALRIPRACGSAAGGPAGIPGRAWPVRGPRLATD